MSAVYAALLVVGMIGLVYWIGASAIGETVDGWEGVHPERRFGVTGRRVVAATVGAGMAGMSSSFAGWAAPLTVLAALGGFGALWLLAGYLGRPSE